MLLVRIGWCVLMVLRTRTEVGVEDQNKGVGLRVRARGAGVEGQSRGGFRGSKQRGVL